MQEFIFLFDCPEPVSDIPRASTVLRSADFGPVLRRSIETPGFLDSLASQRMRLRASIKRFARFAVVGITAHFPFFQREETIGDSGRSAVTGFAFERSRTKFPERNASARIAARRTQAEKLYAREDPFLVRRKNETMAKRSAVYAFEAPSFANLLRSRAKLGIKNNFVREMTPLQIEHFFPRSPTFCVFLLTGFSHPTILRFQIRGNVVAPGGPGRGC
jgi:hypothetical protein